MDSLGGLIERLSVIQRKGFYKKSTLRGRWLWAAESNGQQAGLLSFLRLALTCTHGNIIPSFAEKIYVLIHLGDYGIGARRPGVHTVQFDVMLLTPLWNPMQRAALWRLRAISTRSSFL